MGSSHTQCLVSREMNHPCIELIIQTREDINPVFIKDNKFLDALIELILIEEWHIEMLSGFVESTQVFLSAESLEFSCLGILHD